LKNTKFEAESLPILGKFRGKHDISNTHISLVRNLQLHGGILQLVVAQSFFTNHAAAQFK